MADALATQQADALQHIFDIFHMSDANHPVRLAYGELGCTTFLDLYTVRFNSLKTIKYLPPGTTSRNDRLNLNEAEIARGLMFKGYSEYFKRHHNRNPSATDWLTVTHENVVDYITSSDYLYFNEHGTAPPTPPTSTPQQVGPVTSQLHTFNKGIKRDSTAFLTFKDDKEWNTWKIHTTAVASAQQLSDVLDPTFTPLSPDGDTLFKAQNAFLYAVFIEKLKTVKGIELWRQYETHPYAAQQIFAALSTHHTEAAQAHLDSSDVLEFLTGFMLGKDPWKHTTVAFISYWQNQLSIYLKNTKFPIPDPMKLVMMQKAVKNIDRLQQVENSLRTHLSTNSLNAGQTEFTVYLTLLEQAAVHYDNAHKRSYTNRQPTKVYSALSSIDSAPPDFDSGFLANNDDPIIGGDPPDSDLLDTPVHSIQAFAARSYPNTRSGGTRSPSSAFRIPDDVFKELTADARRAWSTGFTESDRELLFKAIPSPRPTAGPGLTSVHRKTLMHEQHPFYDAVSDLPTPPVPVPMGPATQPSEPSRILNAVKHHPAELRSLLAPPKRAPKSVPAPAPPPSRSVNWTDVSPSHGETFLANDGHEYRRINLHQVHYRFSNMKAYPKQTGSLIDRGANGGLAGRDCRFIATVPDRIVTIEGIDKHQVNDIPLVSVGAYTITKNHGPVIAIFHQMAGYNKGPSIISAIQLECHGVNVNDRSRRIDQAGQLITTGDGFQFPLHLRNGLPYLDMRPYTDDEFESLPHVLLTSDEEWDPSILDGEYPMTGNEEYKDASEYDNGTNFDAQGNYRKGTIIASARTIMKDPILQHTVLPDELLVKKQLDSDDVDVEDDLSTTSTGNGVVDSTTAEGADVEPPGEPPPTDDIVTKFKNISPHVARKDPDPSSLRQFFAWLPTEVVKRTLECTTQYARVPITGEKMKRYYKSPYPAANVPRRDEDLLVDIVYSDVPAIDDGSTSAAIYSGEKSRVLDCYGMKTDAQFVNTLEDIIRERGAPTRLLSDHAITIRSQRVLDILRALLIGQWTSEPHRQHQNKFERRYQTVKRLANVCLDRTGSPASLWLLCLQYVCLVLNCTVCKSLDWKIPLTFLLGVTIDISCLLRFHWYQPVFYAVDESTFPSQSSEAFGHFVGVATNCGHVMTYKILTADTNKIIFRSQVRPADDPRRPNLRLTDLFDGENVPSKIFVRSKGDEDQETDYSLPALDPISGEIEHDVSPSMAHVDTSELIGRTFLVDNEADGTKHRARIVEAVQDFHYSHNNGTPEVKRFRLSVNDDQYEELMSYEEVIQHLEKDQNQDIMWKFKRITGHQGPLTQNHPNYMGSKYNVKVEWENGEITYEPLSVIAADDPVTCAIYARDHDLLDQDGWRRFKRLAKREKKLLRMANQAKLRSYNTAPRYMYGFEVPRNYEHAKFLDRRNKNTKWQDCTALEFSQLFEYDTFEDRGPKGAAKIPEGFKRLRVHLVYAVKHDGRHKARLVADGHLTDIPMDSVYSGVVSLRGLRMMIFLAELNGLEVWATDIGNAYLEAKTQEKLYVVAGSEFGALEGHILIVRKALYGLRSSGLRWHERFSACLREEGFTPCKAEPDIWMRPSADKSSYEYIAVYVDDLCIGMKDPKSFLEGILIKKYKFKLKGSGPISFHLGCDFGRDPDGTLYMAPKQYIDRMVAQYVQMFGVKPKSTVTSPLEKNDHPETDQSELLDDKGVTQYQSLVGSMQWAVSIGRLDITTAVMTLSSFRSLPRQGHLERAKRVVAYLMRYSEVKIRFRTHEPDLSGLHIPVYEWMNTVYGTPKEEVPHDAPKPLGRHVQTISYVDANLLHCLLTGRSVTATLHFLNATPVDWFSKKQATVETATYGSEFVAARTCVEQVVDLRNTLRYLGVPLREKSFMFGDNESVVNSSMTPHAKLHKRHNALSFHRVREAIASKVFVFIYLKGENNPADIMSKHWGNAQVWHMLKVLLLVPGDVSNCPGKGEDKYSKPDEAILDS